VVALILREVARAFGCSTRTVRRHQERFAEVGLGALGRKRGYPSGRARLAVSRRKRIEKLQSPGMQRPTRNRTALGFFHPRSRLSRKKRTFCSPPCQEFWVRTVCSGRSWRAGTDVVNQVSGYKASLLSLACKGTVAIVGFNEMEEIMPSEQI
jgi:hypothetical protein